MDTQAQSRWQFWIDRGGIFTDIVACRPDVRRCCPDAARMATETTEGVIPKIYVWTHAGGDDLWVRYFGLKHGALYEDYGTGSAAANLGGWFVARQTPLPVKRVIHQGEPIGRPARVVLEVDASGGIHVSGQVIELGAGSVVI